MPRIQIKRGLKANLPTSSMLSGEQFYTTDRSTLHVATDATTRQPVVPPIDDLATMPAVDGAADLVLMHDASEASGVKEKKITFDAFKAALNIPAGTTDEKVAVVSGGTAGYIWGTDGTDGVLRMGPTMSWVKAAGNGYVTLDVGVIDCGSF
ncbi:hypothetical protein MOJ79_16365 [Calidifontimicrobium sp. SYSU G02091]|uniref:hypothetical protein n=1 Tax=Calidifontimicrobium sp. SYSU G02091 TaxID=2926421 RepID=UPI001F53BB2F|nr:hypothetical protein [Calidifontimicrobium sp. SYSU G02091]MCI1193409.1 hypothetical protein [Calidifontimicrobium sp. SYSU G02091]